MKKVDFHKLRTGEKASILVFSLFLSGLVSLFLDKLNLVSMVFLSILLLLVFMQEKRKGLRLPKAGDTMEFVLFTACVAALIFTDNFRSPFLPAFFAVFYSIAQSLKTFASVTAGTIAFFTVYAASMLLEQDLASLNSRLSMMMFLTLVFLVSISSGKKTEKENLKSKETGEPFSGNGEKPVESLRSILDLTKRLAFSADEKEAIENYFKESPLCPPVCRVLVFYLPEERAVLYEYDSDAEKVVSRMVKIPYQIERSRVPAKIFDQNSDEFLLSAHNEFLAIYHDSKVLENIDQKMLSFVDSIFSEIFLTIRFATYRSHLLEKISATKEFLKELSFSSTFGQILETALFSLKKISGSQKTFFLPFSETEREVLAKAMFRGPLKLLPQETWEKELLNIYKKMAKSLAPSLLGKENFKIFAVPIKKNNRFFGVLGGVTHPEAQTENSLLIAEFIAGLASMSLSGLSTSAQAEHGKTVKDNKGKSYLRKLSLLLEEIEYALKFLTLEDSSKVNKTLTALKGMIESELIQKIASIDGLSAGGRLNLLVAKISDMFRKTKRFEIQNLVDETIDFDFSLFAPVASFLVEALLNSILHSRSKNITVSLFRENGNVHLKIADSGTGFELNKVIKESKKAGNYITGLRKMALNARKINAKMKIRSRLNQGTEVELVF